MLLTYPLLQQHSESWSLPQTPGYEPSVSCPDLLPGYLEYQSQSRVTMVNNMHIVQVKLISNVPTQSERHELFCARRKTFDTNISVPDNP